MVADKHGPALICDWIGFGILGLRVYKAVSKIRAGISSVVRDDEEVSFDDNMMVFMTVTA